MRFIIFAILVLLLNSSCTKTDTGLPGGILKMVQSLSCNCEPYLDMYRWQGEQVFVLKYKGPSCSWIPSFYKTNGESFNLPAGTNFTQFSQQALFIKQVWSCSQQ